MRRLSVRSRRVWLPCLAVAAAAIAGLLLAGSRSQPVNTFALDAPNQFPLLTLKPGMRVCEGPVSSDAPVGGVGIWGASLGAPGRLTVDVLAPSGRSRLASGSLSAGTAEDEYTSRLEPVVPAHTPILICLRGETAAFSLAGSQAVNPKVVMTGPVAGKEFSLVLIAGGHPSLLSSLSTVFSRAELWRPSWVGSWTFWALAAGLLGAFGVGVLAVAAASADDETDGPGPEHDDESGPPSPEGSPEQTSRTAAYS